MKSLYLLVGLIVVALIIWWVVQSPKSKPNDFQSIPNSTPIANQPVSSIYPDSIPPHTTSNSSNEESVLQEISRMKVFSEKNIELLENIFDENIGNSQIQSECQQKYFDLVYTKYNNKGSNPIWAKVDADYNKSPKLQTPQFRNMLKDKYKLKY